MQGREELFVKTRRTLLAAVAASVVVLAAPATAQTCEGTVTPNGTCEFFAPGSCPPGSIQTGAFSDGTKRCERPL